MKIPHKMNPVHCASKDGTRYILNSVSLQGDLAVATDGRTLFAVKGSRDDDDDPRDATIPKRAARAAWPQSKGKRGAVLPMLTIKPVTEGAFATCEVMNRDFDKTTMKEIDGKFPNVEKVIPDTSKYTHRVGLSVELLQNIAKCFGEDQVMIHFNAEGWHGDTNGEPMMITSKSWEAFGILMPCRVTGDGLNSNNALSEIRHRIKRREESDIAEREASIARAQQQVETERAKAEAKIEAERAESEVWLSMNP